MVTMLMLPQLAYSQVIDSMTYRQVEKDLKPLMMRMVHSKSITRGQAKLFVSLYSAYDYYSGEALFSQVLTDSDNYNLVWKTMDKLASLAALDTSFISALISLEDTIKTNAELGEAMGGFVTDAIRHNPKGFVLMYINRNEKSHRNFSRNLVLSEGSYEELVPIFQKTFESSSNARLRAAVKEMLQFAKEQE